MASIPLPALHVNAPADPTEGIQRLMAMRGMMQQQQGQKQIQQQRAIEIQNQQMQQQDQVKLRGLFIKHQGDLDKVIQDAPQSGVSPQTIQGLQLHAVDVKTKTADLVAKMGANAAQQADLMAGAHDAVDKAPAEQKSAVWTQQLQGLQQRGIDISQMPQQYPGDEQFKLLGAVVQGHKQQVEDAFKAAESAKNSAQAGEATARTSEVQANTAKIQAEMNFYKQKGLAPGVPLDAQEAADWMQKNPGKGPADFMRMKAGLVAQENAKAQSAMLSDAAKQMAAENYSQTGQLPAGIRSPGMSASILNQAASGPNGVPNIAANKANYQADAASLKSLQKNFDQVTAFENTAGKNLDVFLKTAKPIIDSGSPWINKPLRSIDASGLGAADQAAFNAARTTALTEIAKVLNSSNASGVLSDSARHEVEGLIGPGATLQQIMSAANVLKQDMANRHEAYQNQINEIKGRGSMGGNKAAPAAAPASGGFDWNAHPKVNQ